MYVKKFPRCARQFVKNFLRKLIFRGRCVRKSRISKEETVQRLQGCKTFQGAMREKIANYKGGNSVCRGPKLFRCVRKLLLVILKCLKEGNSVCRGTKVLRSHFDSKQIGKALPFCFALISIACRQGKAHPVHKKHKFRHNALLLKPSPIRISFGIRELNYLGFFKGFSRVFQGFFKGFSRVFQGFFKGFSRVFAGFSFSCFNCFNGS